MKAVTGVFEYPADAGRAAEELRLVGIADEYVGFLSPDLSEPGGAWDALGEGLPKDELFVYEDALRQRRTVLIALAHNEHQAAEARTVLAESGAETIDVAREKWWLGLRDAEAETYAAQGRDFEQDEQHYRAGFEAAMRLHGRAYQEAVKVLRRECPEISSEEAFVLGYEGGLRYYRKCINSVPTAA